MKISIRGEAPNDFQAIYDLTKAAFAPMPFAGGTEQEVINRLRDKGTLTLSLVAEIEGKIAGHVAFSPGTCDDATQQWFGLGPVSVAPELQRKGIGSALIREGLQTLKSGGATGCIVEGDTAYYPRFGFEPTPHLAPTGVSSAHFMRLHWRDHNPLIVQFDATFYE